MGRKEMDKLIDLVCPKAYRCVCSGSWHKEPFEPLRDDLDSRIPQYSPCLAFTFLFFYHLLARPKAIGFTKIMCTYTRAVAINVDCTRTPQHKVEKHLYKRCNDRPKPGPRCDNPVFDPSLPSILPSHRRGACRVCRDSGASVGSTIYEHVRCISDHVSEGQADFG